MMICIGGVIYCRSRDILIVPIDRRPLAGPDVSACVFRSDAEHENYIRLGKM